MDRYFRLRWPLLQVVNVMEISANAQATLLLTARFGKTEPNVDKPLTPKEWGRFEEWLKQRSLTPEELLRGQSESLSEWHDETVSTERIHALLDRGAALALSVEKWGRTGLWVMTRSDPDYPKRLKERLKGESPTVLFGCGHRPLLENGGLAVVGSRKATAADLAYSREIGKLASEEGESIVSGGARGVDEASMLGALEAEGTVVGVLADGLLRACCSAKYRQHVISRNLALVSPFNPEAGFNAGNAMRRNRYIYCLADAALAVHSGKKGGTWTGAQENLKKQWVPLWVKANDDPESGNKELVDKGASKAPSSVEEVQIKSLLQPTAVPRKDGQGSLF